MIKQAIIISSTDTEIKYKISLAIASRRLPLEDLKIRIRKYMAAHHKKAGESSFVRNYDAVTVTYAVKAKKKAAAPAAKKETPKPAAKKETTKPLSRPTAKKAAKKPTAITPINFMVSKERYEDDEKYYEVTDEATGKYLTTKGVLQKTFNANTCAYSSRYFGEKAAAEYNEANK